MARYAITLAGLFILVVFCFRSHIPNTIYRSGRLVSRGAASTHESAPIDEEPLLSSGDRQREDQSERPPISGDIIRQYRGASKANMRRLRDGAEADPLPEWHVENTVIQVPTSSRKPAVFVYDRPDDDSIFRGKQVGSIHIFPGRMPEFKEIRAEIVQQLGLEHVNPGRYHLEFSRAFSNDRHKAREEAKWTARAVWENNVRAGKKTKFFLSSKGLGFAQDLIIARLMNAAYEARSGDRSAYKIHFHWDGDYAGTASDDVLRRRSNILPLYTSDQNMVSERGQLQGKKRSITDSTIDQDSNAALGSSNSATKNPARYEEYLAAFHTIQAESTELIRPYLIELTSGISSGVFHDAALHLWSELTIADTYTFSPFLYDMHCFDQLEDQFLSSNNLTTNSTEYLEFLAFNAILIDKYQNAWNQSVTVLKKGGYWDDLRFLATYLSTFKSRNTTDDNSTTVRGS